MGGHKTGSWSSIQDGNLPSFLSQCKQATSQGGSVTYSATISPLSTLKDGRNYDTVTCFSDFCLIGFLVTKDKKKFVASSCEV